MGLLYILLVAYILAVNFYAFLLVKSLRDKEHGNPTAKKSTHSKKEQEQTVQNQPPTTLQNQADISSVPSPAPQPIPMGKLFITGLIGGAITIYACTFIFKWKRTDLLLMVLMPMLGVINIYIWVLLFKSGFGFLVIR